MALRSYAKRIALLFTCIAASLVLLVIGIIWLAGREWTLQMAIQRLVATSGGVVSVEGAEGSLYGPLKVHRILFENKEWRIEAHDAELEWSPRELKEYLFHIYHLRAKTLEVHSKISSDKPLEPPTNLRLPLALLVDELHLDTLTIAEANNAPVVLKNVAANLQSRGSSHIVNLTAIESPWASGNARLELGMDKPFPLIAVGQITGRTPRAYEASFKVDGPLDKINLAATCVTKGGRATLDAKITPFAKAPINAFTLKTRDIDLHDFDAALPFTQLAAEAAGNIDDKGAFNAQLSVSNSVPGTIDLQRLPIKNLGGQLAGAVENLTARHLTIDLGAGGQFTGDGTMKNGGAAITLATGNLNIQGLHGKLKPTHAVGALTFTLFGKDFADHRLQSDLTDKKLNLRLRLDATHAKNEIRIDAAELTAATGQLNAQGRLGLVSQQSFELTGKLVRFNPAAFGKFPSAMIGADMQASGQLAPMHVAGRFALTESTLRNHPLSGKGTIEVTPHRIAQADVTLTLAGNRVDVKGAFGRANDELNWQLDATDLASIDSSFAGRARGKGTLRGTFDDPAVTLDVAASDLRLPSQLSVAQLEARGVLNSGKNGAIEFHLNADNIKRDRVELAHTRADLTGTHVRHTLQLTAQGKPDVDFTGELTGAWNQQQGWSGQINKLINRGRYALQLRAPAPLIIAPGRFDLRRAYFALADGQFDIDAITWSSGKLSTRGKTKGLSVAYLQTLFPEETRADDVKTTLTFGGSWALEIGETVNGKLEIARESGDLTFVSERPIPLGLTQLDFTTNIVANRISSEFNLQGKTTGVLRVRAETRVSKRDDVWGVAGDAPFNVQAIGDVPSLAWTNLLLNPGYVVDGRVRLNFTRSGTVKKPQVAGSLEADALALRIADYGINLHDGVLRANFEGNRVVLSKFEMHGDEGELTGNGSLKLGETASSFAEGGADIRANGLRILNHPDYRLTVSGDGKIAFAKGKLAITGEVRADHGSIQLPDNERPSLSDDVVIVGKTNTKARKAGATPLSIDLLLDVGKDFRLRGYGLDAMLRGSLRVKSAPPGLPIGTGTIRIAKGTYEAYGQKLEIERGTISFAGPIDNPSLDILAVRKNLPVEAGVAVNGTALGPRVKLVSTPPAPDTEKLAWLVLGHGLEGSTGAEMELLPVAAAALLSSRGRSPTKGIAEKFGLDEIGLARSSASSTGGSSTGNTLAEQRVLTVGKRISSNLYLTYEAGLDAASRVLRLQYEISRRWSVRAETGTRSAVDLFYTLRFD